MGMHQATFSGNETHPEKDNISVVGIGDMSGDVFGNGMLLSKTISLVKPHLTICIFSLTHRQTRSKKLERTATFI